MTNSNQLVHRGNGAAGAVALPAGQRVRPTFGWSDIWKAPLHDFPLRDEILYQFLPLSASMKLLEIGPGSGFTAFRLARRVRQLTLVEVGTVATAELRERFRETRNIRVVCADATQLSFADMLQDEFDTAFCLDVFEYVVDPAVFLRNVAAVLRPGGEIFLSYPNVPPPAGDGMTCFSRLAQLEGLLAAAGFHDWQIFAVRLRRNAAAVYGLLHEWPLRLYRWLRRRERIGLPQTYEATWAFRHGRRLLRYKVPLHLLWLLLGAGLRLGGPVFSAEPATDGILGRQLVIRAWR